MAKQSQYQSHLPDADGIVHWCDDENKMWQDLMIRQRQLLDGRACDEYLQGLALLDLPTQRVPQLAEVNGVLAQTTGWEVVPVPALINFDEFFRLLANKQFPVATFIRSREEFDYLQEPDVFHEVFGHCPLLTNPAFAHFTHTYGKLGYGASKEQRSYLARLYWFTVEFGLVKTAHGTRIYGGGILSSPEETIYALENEDAVRLPLVPLDVMRTPYRIDIIQPVYFLLREFSELFELADMDIMSLVQKAQTLGLYPARFAQKTIKAS
ncbi:MAG: phenylalanine-4-hydroxylase [Paraglaciecola sp.]|jgi:phenylalanine-4-hydroxylase